MRTPPPGLSARHYDLLARWWADNDPAFAEACAGEAVMAALIAGPPLLDPTDVGEVGAHTTLWPLTREAGKRGFTGDWEMAITDRWGIRRFLNDDGWYRTVVVADRLTTALDAQDSLTVTTTTAILRAPDGMWIALTGEERSVHAYFDDPAWLSITGRIDASLRIAVAVLSPEARGLLGLGDPVTPAAPGPQ